MKSCQSAHNNDFTHKANLPPLFGPLYFMIYNSLHIAAHYNLHSGHSHFVVCLFYIQNLYNHQFKKLFISTCKWCAATRFTPLWWNLLLCEQQLTYLEVTWWPIKLCVGIQVVTESSLQDAPLDPHIHCWFWWPLISCTCFISLEFSGLQRDCPGNNINCAHLPSYITLIGHVFMYHLGWLFEQEESQWIHYRD